MKDRVEYIPKNRVDKNKLRAEILTAMVDCAKNIRGYYEAAAGLIIDENYPLPEIFRPGIADKLLFLKIVEENWERILDIYCCAPLSGRMIAFGLMLDSYYPLYGNFRRITLEEMDIWAYIKSKPPLA